jgi:hypothetical protein
MICQSAPSTPLIVAVPATAGDWTGWAVAVAPNTITLLVLAAPLNPAASTASASSRATVGSSGFVLSGIS